VGGLAQEFGIGIHTETPQKTQGALGPATLPCGGIIRIRFKGFFSPGKLYLNRTLPGPPAKLCEATGIVE
jgi:hypothetical protein